MLCIAADNSNANNTSVSVYILIVLIIQEFYAGSLVLP